MILIFFIHENYMISIFCQPGIILKNNQFFEIFINFCTISNFFLNFFCTIFSNFWSKDRQYVQILPDTVFLVDVNPCMSFSNFSVIALIPIGF